MGMHALNLAIQETVKSNVILRDTLDTVEEMTKLIKKSPKRQGIFEKYHEQISMESPGIHMLATTRWTVRTDAFASILENYEALFYTWTEARQVCRDSEMCARIGGVAKQMESFEFLFGLELGRIVFNMADNLSKALQGTSVSASDGQNLMKLTVTAYEKLRTDDSFLGFWNTVEKKLQLLKVDEPHFTRQRKVPKRYEVGSSIPCNETSVQDVYKRTYFEVIDHAINAIKRRFDQDGYKVLCRLEPLLCHPNPKPDDFKDTFQLYRSDLDQERLLTQLHILHSNAPKVGVQVNDLIAYLKSMNAVERTLYLEVFELAKLILVMPATNSISERSFSALRRLKTWLRSTMNQNRLNWCMVLHVHKTETDLLDLKHIGNEFIIQAGSTFLGDLCNLTVFMMWKL